MGTRRESILMGFESAMEENGDPVRTPEKWDGRAAERITAVLSEIEKGKMVGLRMTEKGQNNGEPHKTFG